MNLICEICRKSLSAEVLDSEVKTAVKARMAGGIVKNFILHGGDSGDHYFCSDGCKNIYKKQKGLSNGGESDG